MFRLTLIFILLLNSQLSLALFDCVKGVGPDESKVRDLTGVSELVLRSSYDINIKHSRRERMEINGPKVIINNMVFVQIRLLFTIDHDRCVKDKDSLEITVYLSKLSLVKILGASDVQVVDRFYGPKFSVVIAGAGDLVGDFNVKNLNIAIKGSGDVKVSGLAKILKVDIVGSGDVSALGLKSKSVVVNVKGSGDLGVNASDNLDIKIYGSGDVRYKGRPKVNVAKYGTGNISSI